jgi:hypothetical protein
VLGDVGDGHLGLGGERLDVAGGLGEQVDQLEAAVAGEGGGDAGELWVEALLEGAVAHGARLAHFAEIFNRPLDKRGIGPIMRVIKRVVERRTQDGRNRGDQELGEAGRDEEVRAGEGGGGARWNRAGSGRST